MARSSLTPNWCRTLMSALDEAEDPRMTVIVCVTRPVVAEIGRCGSERPTLLSSTAVVRRHMLAGPTVAY